MGLRPQRVVEVRVLSYNMHHGENKWGESNLRDVLKIIQDQKPQIVALQAVDSLHENGRINYQIRRLAAQTGMHYLYGASDSLANGSHGVGILSKWPFENSQKLTLPSSPGADPRTLLCGLISAAEGLTFRICSARLEYASVFDRALQSAYVNQLLAPSIQPVLLALDMGARPNEQPYFSYRTRWLDAAKGSYLPTWTEGISGDRLDYLMALKNTRVRVKSYKVIQDYPDASDHYPILATFEFW
ncbi:endonuclease/exonuclease/phosphatase [Cytophagaceae bacterium SJW1-29]|uniref:Endonuclease/exonuclease/phosphatase n=2 Tax=Salmonirosea aquatica TaxID=2654236 RepID=A0A7C9FBM6_9BACT|nr:endonuclease/exonuclease/phosphatase [Cytophagaceae bacterium SJW1-29]